MMTEFSFWVNYHFKIVPALLAAPKEGLCVTQYNNLVRVMPTYRSL